jgi:hypothetical protein
MEVTVEKLNSSILKSLDFNAEKKVLVVEFTTGSKYKYIGVDKDSFLAILGADSQGSEFNKLKSKYEYEKLC